MTNSTNEIQEDFFEKLDSEKLLKERTPLELIARRFAKHKLAVFSLILMIAIFLISVFAAQISPFKVDELDIKAKFAPPGAVQAETGRTHFLGSDEIGRDYFSRVIYAGRISLSVAVFSVIISIFIGVVVGAISGFFGGVIDAIAMRFVEFLLTIPSLPLLLIISAILLQDPEAIPIPNFVLQLMGKIMLLTERDARSAVLIILVLAGLGWMTAAQLMRGQLLALRELTYVEAARSMGASNFEIIIKHMIPNAMAPIIVTASLDLAGYVVAEAALSFLGFGIQDPIPTWGNMLAATQTYMLDKPYLPLIPGLPIFICSLAFNYVGDGLRDALDPRLKM
ncbi:MAG TPA: ABC transporter permease [Anaerolineaceae bacterium]|nr:ABC transporter permease [Anaerolineaceae bacterium]HPN51276.1 ABC transporter permease [Anaerolineaceae bacterium]